VTRLLRPPHPLIVSCDGEGSPRSLSSGSQRRQVTRVVRAWVQHRLALALDEPWGDRAYDRVLLDGIVLWDIFEERGAWFLERIIN